MSAVNFQELCRQFCETDGFPHPFLQHDDQGRLAFSVRVKGVTVTALEFRDACVDSASLIAEFGGLPVGYEDAVWHALLDANLVMMHGEAPQFSRNKITGRILLQWNCPLPAVTPGEVLRRVQQMADMVLVWREERTNAQVSALSTVRCGYSRASRVHRNRFVRSHGQSSLMD